MPIWHINHLYIKKKQISTTDGQSFAQEIGAVFSETSALTATNVESLFIEIG